MGENIVLEKSYKFALRVVKLYKYLIEVRKEFVISKRLLADGTDLGAHVKAAQEAEGRSGFIHEMSAVLKKAPESNSGCDSYATPNLWMKKSSIR
jgi:hypothetical protein